MMRRSRITVWGGGVLGALLCAQFMAEIGQCETSAPEVHAFNEFNSQTVDVDPLSGQANVSVPLGEAGVTLRYSSNVQTSVRERNHLASTGWLGLGWAMGTGKIVCNHQSSTYLGDDEYVYVSGEGVAQRIIWDAANNRGTLERDPFSIVLRVEQVDPEENAVRLITGWTILDKSGAKLVFGDVAGVSGSLSTWYTYYWPGGWQTSSYYVGEGFESTPRQFPWQWCLSAEEDAAGNRTTYEYDTTARDIGRYDWRANVLYTRASHLKRIRRPGGIVVEFRTGTKDDLEYVDAHQARPEPDVFMEYYDSLYLSEVEVQQNGHDVRRYEFCYRTINRKQDAPYAKRLLHCIREFDAYGLAVGGPTVFEYHETELATEGANKGREQNFGVLRSVEYANCAQVEFGYEKMILPVSPRTSSHVPFGADTILSGLVEGGNEYFIIGVRAGSDKREMSQCAIYTWVGDCWKVFPEPGNDDGRFADMKNSMLLCGNDFILAFRQDVPAGAGSITAYFWDKYDQEWLRYPTSLRHIVDCGANRDAAYLGGTIVVARRFYNAGEEGHVADEQVCEVFSVVPAARTIDRTASFTSLEGDAPINSWALTANGSGYFAHKINATTVQIVMLNAVGEHGNQQVDVKDVQYISSLWQNLIAGGRHLVASAERINSMYVTEQDAHAYAWTWNGKQFTVTMRGKVLDRSADQYPVAGQDLVATAAISPRNQFNLLRWTGENWKLNQFRYDSRNDHEIAAGTDFVARLHPTHITGRCNNSRKRDRITTWRFVDGKSWEKQELGTVQFPTGVEKEMVAGSDFLLVRQVSHDEYRHFLRPLYVNAVSEDGGAFSDIERIISDRHEGSRPKEVKYVTARDAVCVLGTFHHYREDHLCKSGNQHIWGSGRHHTMVYLAKQMENHFPTTVGEWVVKKRMVTDRVTGRQLEWKYSYDLAGGSYSTLTDNNMFGKATVNFPGEGGSAEYQFEVQNRRQLGALRSTIVRGGDGGLVSSTTNSYTNIADVWQNTYPEGTNYYYLSARTDTKGGLVTTTTTEVDKHNGLPSRTTVVVGDEKRIAETVYAHDFWTPMKDHESGTGRRLLTQVCQTTKYIDEAPFAVTPQTSDVVSSKVAMWRPEYALMTYVPGDQYEWVTTPVPDGASPPTYSLPAMTPFNYSSPASNGPQWLWTGSTTRYSRRGLALTTTRRGATPGTIMSSSVLYGHGDLLAIAEVTNATDEQVGILTGDFDEAETDGSAMPCFDADNGWRKGGATLVGSPSVKHFGDSVIQVAGTCTGPNKQFDQLKADEDYTFCAWLFPVDISVGRAAVLSVTKGGASILHVKHEDLVPGKWTLVSRTLPKADLADVSETTPLQIAVSSEGGASFYVEDIRFHPSTAKVATTYYDAIHKRPVAGVGTNNVAGVHVAFDERGRKVKEFRRGRDGIDTVLSTVEYSSETQCAKHEEPRIGKVTVDGVEVERADGSLVAFVDAAADAAEVTLDAASSRHITAIDGASSGCPSGLAKTVALTQALRPVVLGVEDLGGAQTTETLYLKRKGDCWNDEGSGPFSDQSVTDISLKWLGGGSGYPYVAYRDGGGVVTIKKYQDPNWVSLPALPGNVGDMDFCMHNGEVYAAYRYSEDSPSDGRIRVYRLSGGTWTLVGGDASASPGHGVRILSDGTNLYLLYRANESYELGSGVDAAVPFVKRLDSGVWSPLPAPSGKPVSEGVDNAEMAVVAGVLYLAYSHANTDPNETFDPNDGLLFVSRYVAGAWEPVGGALSARPVGSIRLATYGSYLYVAASEEQVNPVMVRGKTATHGLAVRSFNGSTWTQLGTGYVTFLSGDDTYQLATINGVPVLEFGSVLNDGLLSTVRYSGPSWVPFDGDNPGFMASSSEPGAGFGFVVSPSSNVLFLAVNKVGRTGEAVLRANSGSACSNARLNDLQVVAGSDALSLTPQFVPYMLEYETSVGPSVSKVDVSVEPSDPTNQHIYMNGREVTPVLTGGKMIASMTVELPAGYTDIVVRVEGPGDGSGAAAVLTTYIVRVNRPRSAFVSLCGFRLSKENGIVIPYTPTYDVTQLSYDAGTVGEDVSAVLVKPVVVGGTSAASSGTDMATNKVNRIPLRHGRNVIPIVAQSPDGSKTIVYELVIHRNGSSDVALSGLVPSVGSLSPSLSNNVFDYRVAVGSTDETVRFTTTQPDLIVQVEGDEVVSGEQCDPVELHSGENHVPIALYTSDDEGGALVSEYDVVVVRPATSACRLDGLTLKTSSGVTLDLDQTFSSTTYSYSMSVDADMEEVVWVPTSSSPGADIGVGGEWLDPPGVTEIRTALVHGINEFVVTVATADDRVEYAVRIARAVRESNPEVFFEMSGATYDETATLAGNRVAVLPLQLAGTPDGEATVAFEAATSSTAQEGADFYFLDADGARLAAGVAHSVTINVCAGEAKVRVEIVDDDLIEGDQTAVVALKDDGTTNASLGATATFELVIRDDDFPVVSFEEYFTRKLEGQAGAQTTFSVPVRLTGELANDLRVPFSVVQSGATSPTDFTVSGTSLTFEGGAASPQTRMIQVTIVGDNVEEADESFSLKLSTPVGAEDGDILRHMVTIVNDDATVAFATGGGSVGEGDGYFDVSVRLSRAIGNNVTIPFTVGGSAGQGATGDFVISSPAGDLLIEAGQVAPKDVLAVKLVDDGILEASETVLLTLGTPAGAAVAVGTPSAFELTIQDNDLFQVGFVEARGSGSESLEYPQAAVAIDRIHTSGEPSVTVDYTVTPLNGAVAGTDYVLANGSLTWTFCSGGCGLVADLGLQILEDTDLDPGERVKITLSNPVNAKLVKGKTEFIYTIIDNEQYYTLTVLNDGNGTTTPSGAVQVRAGEPVAVTAEGLSNKVFAVWQVVEGSVSFGSEQWVPGQVVTLTLGSADILATFKDACGGNVLYVRGTAAEGGDGCAWATAFRSVQQALSTAASSNGAITEVWVAKGTYTPEPTNGRLSTFTLAPNVALRGGFAGTEATRAERSMADIWGANVTTLSGTLGSVHSFHVVSGAPGAVIDGFVVQGGKAEYATDHEEYARGGGLLAVDGMAVVNCRFAGNYADICGGAIYATGQVAIQSCLFAANYADAWLGGGALCATGATQVVNCGFTDNYISAGPTKKGGAIYNQGSMALVNCTFRATELYNGEPDIVGSSVYSTADLVIHNSLFSEADRGSDWPLVYHEAGTMNITNSFISADDVGGSPPDGFTGNFFSPPVLLNPDLRQLINSSCLDAGALTAVVPVDEYDIDGDDNTTERVPALYGDDRVSVNGIDIGATEGDVGVD